MLKKSTLAVLGLAFSTITAAGTMGCQPGAVTVPCEDKKWDLGIQALYMKPSYTGDHVYVKDAALASNQHYAGYDPKWGWGYRLEGSYHYGTGTDITMTWMHYDVDTKTSGFPFVNVFAAGQTNTFSITNNNLFDQVNLVKAQHVDVGLVKNLRFYGGLQFAKVRNDMDYNYPSTVPAYMNQYTDYKGVGPVVGIDYAYEFANGFSLTANGATSILYGNGRYGVQSVSTAAPTANGIIVSAFQSTKMVVPSLEGKLGINYAHQMPQGVLNVELGYQVLNYFNALRGANYAAPLVSTANVVKPGYSDFALNGMYAGLKWVGQA